MYVLNDLIKMGFDNIISKFEERGDGIIFKAKPKNYIKKEFKHKKDSSVLYAIVPPWHTEPKLSSILNKNIFKNRGSYIDYVFSPEIVSIYPDITKRCYETIKKTVRADLKKLAKKYSFSKIVIIGISLGCVNACMIANNNPLIKKIILIAPGHCLAESLWNGVRTRRLKQEIEKKGINLEKLKKAWKRLAPENNIAGLKGKDIYVYLSKADEAIPYYGGKSLVESMKKKGLNPFVETNRYLGHYLTVLRFMFFPKKFLK